MHVIIVCVVCMVCIVWRLCTYLCRCVHVCVGGMWVHILECACAEQRLTPGIPQQPLGKSEIHWLLEALTNELLMCLSSLAPPPTTP